MQLKIGSTVADYQIVGALGAGGMGKVYKVRNLISDRIEAMKVLLPDLANEPELADRFMREIKVQASLEHPNIAALHTALRVQNQLLMLMEYVEGSTLEEKLKGGPLTISATIDYIMQALAALDYAHSRGVIHRDIKPANMMLTPAGVIKLMDFGIAKAATDRRLTTTGTTLGSLYYISPEQIQGVTTLDPRSDLYSVGVSLYELVTGKRPFDGDSAFAIMSAHLEKTALAPVAFNPKLPRTLNDLILLSLAKGPDGRFQSAAAFRKALANFAAAEKPAAAEASEAKGAASAVNGGYAGTQAAQAAAENYHPVEPKQPAPPRSKRWLWMGLGGAVTAMVIIGLIQFGPWHGTKAAPAPQANPAPAAVSAPAPAGVPVRTPVQPASALQSSPAPPLAGASGSRSKTVPSSPEAREAAPAPNAQAGPDLPAAPAQIVAPSSPPQQVAAPPAQAPAIDPAKAAELRQARDQFIRLNSRADAVRASLQAFERSQAASGLNLRGDMQQAASLMNSYLESAASALNQGDPAAAKDSMEKAERQIERLEKFFGR